ncbi:MAG: hypothetical protein PUF64_05130 [Butyricicoccus sp.]|nr:hypothetical protein [Butyricicoccus sp.]
MLLGDGIVTIYRQEDTAQPGEMPEYAWTQVWQSFFGEKTVGVNRYYTAMAHDDRTDMYWSGILDVSKSGCRNL